MLNGLLLAGAAPALRGSARPRGRGGCIERVAAASMCNEPFLAADPQVKSAMLSPFPARCGRAGCGTSTRPRAAGFSSGPLLTLVQLR